MTALCFYEGGNSIIAVAVESSKEMKLKEDVYLQSVDFPVILKPETLDHMLHLPLYDEIPSEYELCPEPNKLRLLELFSHLGLMQFACDFLLRRDEKSYILRDLTVFLYFCDAELRKCEELEETLETEFKPLVRGEKGILVSFLTKLETGKRRLNAVNELLMTMRSRGAARYSPSSIDKLALYQSFQVWKSPSTSLFPGLGGVYSHSKLREFITAVVTWTDRDLLDSAWSRQESLRRKVLQLEWMVRHDSLTPFVESLNWEMRKKGKIREVMNRINTENRLLDIGFPYIAGKLMFESVGNMEKPPRHFADFGEFLGMERERMHWVMVYLMLDLGYHYQNNEEVSRDLETLRWDYLHTFTLSQAAIARIEGCWKLDLAYELSPEDRKPLLCESLQQLSMAAELLTGAEKELVLKAFFELESEEWTNMLLWAETMVGEMETMWPFVVKALISTGQLTKAFSLSETLFSLNSKRQIHEVFLLCAEESHCILESIYLPWTCFPRLEQALRHIQREDLVLYATLAQQKYKEMGDGPGLSGVVNRCVGSFSDISWDRNLRLPKSIHRPRLPIENLSSVFPRSQSSFTPQRLTFDS